MKKAVKSHRNSPKNYSFVPKGQTQPQHGTGWCFCDLGRVSEVNEQGQKILWKIKKLEKSPVYGAVDIAFKLAEEEGE